MAPAVIATDAVPDVFDETVTAAGAAGAAAGVTELEDVEVVDYKCDCFDS